MSDRIFSTEMGHRVRYAVGQPMGFKSSFDMLALTHHVIIHAAATLAGIVNFTDYAVLGDDSVIANAEVVRYYRLIMDELGVNISVKKSVSPGTPGITGAEFAKRLFVNGVEITPIPVHLLANAIGNSDFHLELWEKMMEREILSGNELWLFFSSFLRDSDAPGLFMLMGCPEGVSGLRHPVPYRGAPMCNSKNWEGLYGFSATDLECFYAFILLQEQMASLSGVLSKASTWMSIALEGSKLSSSLADDIDARPVMPLSVLVREKIQDLSIYRGVSHPVQDAARCLGKKIVNVLNLLNSGTSSVSGKLLDRSIQSLSISLDSKPVFGGKRSMYFGDRRILEKALRAIEKTRKDGK
jgi:hypothetical protein